MVNKYQLLTTFVPANLHHRLSLKLEHRNSSFYVCFMSILFSLVNLIKRAGKINGDDLLAKNGNLRTTVQQPNLCSNDNLGELAAGIMTNEYELIPNHMEV